MAAGTTFASSLANLILNGIAIAGFADDAAVAPYTDLYLGLYTASPGAGGDQTTNECTYTGYARQAVARDALTPAWAVVAGVANLIAAVAFPICTAGTETATHVALGTAASGAGEIVALGTITPTIPITVGAIPVLSTSTQLSIT